MGLYGLARAAEDALSLMLRWMLKENRSYGFALCVDSSGARCSKNIEAAQAQIRPLEKGIEGIENAGAGLSCATGGRAAL